MKRGLLALMTFIVAAVARPASAARALPTVDAFARIPPSASEPSARERAKGVDVVHEEPRLGVPTFVWGVRAAQAGAKGLRPVSPEQAARAYLGEQAGLYRLGRTDAPHIPVRGLHRTRTGASIVTFAQEVEGVEVFRQSLKVLLDADNQLIAMSGYLSPVASQPRLEKAAPAFRLEPREAIARAWRDLHGDPLPAVSLSLTGFAQGPYSHYALSPGPRRTVFSSPARVKKVYFPLTDTLVPAWYVELDTTPANETDGDQYAYVISAVEGKVLYRHDLSADQSYTYRVWADTQSPHIPFDGPQGNAATPHPTGLPDGYQAPFVTPNLLTLQNTPFSRNDPWLPMGATQTVGNNVEAYVDLVPPSGFGPGDLHGSLGESGIFGDGYDLLLAPSVTDAQQMSSVAQIFFVTNFLHDWFYDSGFDEAAGNAQADNFGRGGFDGDRLRAEGQDYFGRNNANMFTPSDGARPRMQMFVYDTKGPRGIQVSQEHPLAGGWPAGMGAFGPQQFSVTAAVAFADDGVAAPGGRVTDACEPLTNAATVAGKIVLVDQPGCDFAVKAAHAQAAGAVGVVIIPEQEDGVPFPVSGRAPSVTIPVVSVEQYLGVWFRSQLPASLTLYRSGADRDGTLDNTIVAHEWMHYMSNRLIGDANGLTNNQGRSMGEGWGDFAGLLMVVREGDDQLPSNANFNGVYARGAYVNSGGVNQGYYWGSRRYPYTTDLSKNPLTLRYIENGVRLPDDIPVNFGRSGLNNAEVHSSGEVWAVTLWECYAALLRDKQRLTFAQAQQRMKDYLVASMKLTPIAPTFLEARDALLAVTYAHDRADYVLFAQAFAKRGAGTRAVAPERDSAEHHGVVESFHTGKDVVLASVEVLEQTGTAASCDDDGTLDTGETVRLRLTLRNSGIERLTQTSVTLSSNTPDLSFPEGMTVPVPATDPLQSVTVEMPVRLTGPATPRVIPLTVAWRDAEQTTPGDQTSVMMLRVNTDALPGTGVVETVDSAIHPWLLEESPYPNALPWSRQHDPGSEDWFFHGPNSGSVSEVSLVSPPLEISAAGAFRFTFQFRYVLEELYDGGVIELSEDDGLSWTDIGQFVSPSYTMVIDAQGDNPIEGRMAYSGESEGYPAFIQGVANLGTAYAGKTVRIRFRIGTDSVISARGWDVDDLQFEGLVNTPFTTSVPHRGLCTNRVPVANAGPAQTLNERRRVTLSGSGMDPEGATLTYAWTQTAGPQVVFSSASVPAPGFRAPEVTEDTDLTFELRVHDGVYASAPSTVTVRVRDISQGNRAPVSSVAPVAAVNEGAMVALVGSGSDPDEDVALTYAWTQVGGPTVTLLGATASSTSFMAPQVASDTELTFQLVVSDGELSSPPALVTVLVRNIIVNLMPLANAGPGQTLNERRQVTLSGSGEDPEGAALTYAWTQTAGPQVVLSSASVPAPGFRAPEVTEDTDLTFELRVHDGVHASAPSAVTVRVRNISQGNRAPEANVAPVEAVNEGASVALHGGGADADEDVALTYAWTQVGGPTVSLTEANASSAGFTAPQVDSDTELTFQLVVSDGELSSPPASVKVLVKNVFINQLPVAQAGEDQRISEGGQVRLSGAGSTDPDASVLTYAWIQVDGPGVQLTVDGANATFTAPAVDADTELTFKLLVTDAHGGSSEDTMKVSVSNVPVPAPDSGCGCSAGQEGSVPGAIVMLLAALGFAMRRPRVRAVAVAGPKR